MFSLPRPSVLRALAARDFAVLRSYRLPLVFDLLFGLLTLVTFFFISQTFDAASEDLHAAPTYFAFVAAGVAMSIVIDSASAGVARKLREEQLTGTLEALVVEPVTPAEIALGLAGFPFLFASVRAPLYLFIASIFLGLDTSRTNWIGFVLTIALSGPALASFGIVLGAIIIVLKRGETLAAFMAFALGMLGGALFPVTVLPWWLELPGRLTPTRYVFAAVRETLFLGAVWPSELAVLLGFSAAGLPLATWVFARALRRARRVGSLGQY